MGLQSQWMWRTCVLRRKRAHDPTSQLLLNTLALEDSIGREDWNAASALLEERDSILSKLEREIDESCLQMIDVVQEAESRLMKALKKRMRVVVGDLEEGRRARKASRAYSHAASANTLGDY